MTEFLHIAVVLSKQPEVCAEGVLKYSITVLQVAKELFLCLFCICRSLRNYLYLTPLLCNLHCFADNSSVTCELTDLFVNGVKYPIYKIQQKVSSVNVIPRTLLLYVLLLFYVSVEPFV